RVPVSSPSAVRCASTPPALRPRPSSPARNPDLRPLGSREPGGSAGQDRRGGS
ncbi:hypothetical protein M9458_042832, partial [Cirrhinus mrigala]